MENKSESDIQSAAQGSMSTYVKSMKLPGGSLIKKEESLKNIRSNELFQLNGEDPMDELAGVCIGNVHYYDFKNILFINNTGIACLIDLLKCLLETGVKVQFVNVSEKIKIKIRTMGLEDILNCS
jgi:hypothetical protein